MPGLAAGVVTEAQVNSGIPSPPSKFAASLASPATWSVIWAVVALMYLVGIYLGMIVIRRRNT
jgi:hypothetical protein